MSPICDALSNLGYGVFASTLVAFLLEIRDVRIKNSEFARKYVLTMSKFLDDYIFMMSLYRKQAVKLNREYEFKEMPWSQWRDIVVKWVFKEELIKTANNEQNEHCQYNDTGFNQSSNELETAISMVLEDINYIFQAGPASVVNGIDDISYDRMIKIKNRFDSVMHLKLSFPEKLYEIMDSIIVEECNSWFLLKGLDEEVFGPNLDNCINIREKRMQILFDE